VPSADRHVAERALVTQRDVAAVDLYGQALLEPMPVERILFGSDWPQAEGLADPKQYFDYLTALSVDDRRKVMRDIARELTFTRRGITAIRPARRASSSYRGTEP
jgi:hypothetical protein